MSKLTVALVAVCALAFPAGASAGTVHCGGGWNLGEEVRFAHVTLTISTSAMSAIYRQDPLNWTSRRASDCELAFLIAGQAANGEANSTSFVGMGAHFYVGRYHCTFREAGEALVYEGVRYSAERARCSHSGRYANQISFLETVLRGAKAGA
ncbi:MAG TPA: hypothetical protein VII01_10270 [Solirubrobacteraceae bacterium]